MKYETIQDAIASIESRRRVRKDLPAFQRFVYESCPQIAQLKIIHVAGTNGKGSTVNYMRAMLNAAGLRVGTLTSPALISHLDRIRIDDQWIGEQTFLDHVNRYDEQWRALELAMFDIDVHIALCWFVHEKADVVILETGLGGRLDATNIVLPCASVITNIGHDHMQLLGDTLEKTAWEKAGIIKEGVPLLTAEKRPSCLRVFETVCAQRHASLYRSSAHDVRRDENGDIHFDAAGLRDLRLSSPAAYQAENAALALETIRLLFPDLHARTLRPALAATGWAGRFQLLHRRPDVIVDGAHNREGVSALCETLRSMHVDTVIFSVLKDKECDRMIEMIRMVCDRLILCSFPQGRLADLEELAHQHHLPLAHDLRALLEARMKEDEVIVISGSLYFVSEAVALFQHGHV